MVSKHNKVVILFVALMICAPALLIALTIYPSCYDRAMVEDAVHEYNSELIIIDHYHQQNSCIHILAAEKKNSSTQDVSLDTRVLRIKNPKQALKLNGSMLWGSGAVDDVTAQYQDTKCYKKNGLEQCLMHHCCTKYIQVGE